MKKLIGLAPNMPKTQPKICHIELLKAILLTQIFS